MDSSNSSTGPFDDPYQSVELSTSDVNSETAALFVPLTLELDKASDAHTRAPDFAPPIQIRNICCVGAGYVGGPTAAVIALQNPHLRVTVVDKDAARIARWNSRHLPILEPGLYDIVRCARDGLRATRAHLGPMSWSPPDLPARAPNLFFSTEISRAIAEADLILLSVNTPTKMTGMGVGQATNMSALEGATRDIALVAKPGAIVVEKSTVPCRTAQVIHDTLAIYRPGVPFEILSNPEFLAEGTAIKNLLNPDRIIIGSLQTANGIAAAAALKNVYSSWVDPAKIITVNLWSSELAKLVANAMLAQRISSINTISAVCELTGANIDEVARTVGLDQRLGPHFLKAGIGFGGSCFKKDILSLVYLANSLELPEVGEYWMQVLKINEFQRIRFVQRILAKLNGNLIGKKIAILGYAFKKDTNDTRESPVIDVVKQLIDDAPSEIAIFDPYCRSEVVKKRLHNSLGLDVLKPEGPIEVYNESYDACTDASAVLILTDWDQFRYPSLAVPRSVCHEGSQQESNVPRLYETKRSDVELLTLHERKQSLNVCRSREVGFCDPPAPFEEGPQCPQGCRECARADGEDVIAHESLEWARIAYHMREPKCVFDGRGIVDVDGMERLGFRVETIGRAGTRSRLNVRVRPSFALLDCNPSSTNVPTNSRFEAAITIHNRLVHRPSLEESRQGAVAKDGEEGVDVPSTTHPRKLDYGE